MLANTLLRFFNLDLTKPSPPEKGGFEYGYAMFEPMPDIYVDISKHTPIPPVGISNINVTNDS